MKKTIFLIAIMMMSSVSQAALVYDEGVSGDFVTPNPNDNLPNTTISLSPGSNLITGSMRAGAEFGDGSLNSLPNYINIDADDNFIIDIPLGYEIVRLDFLADSFVLDNLANDARNLFRIMVGIDIVPGAFPTIWDFQDDLIWNGSSLFDTRTSLDTTTITSAYSSTNGLGDGQVAHNSDLQRVTLFLGQTTYLPDFAFNANKSIYATLDYSFNLEVARVSPVPIPATIWLFGSALLGLFGLKRKWN